MNTNTTGKISGIILGVVLGAGLVGGAAVAQTKTGGEHWLGLRGRIVHALGLTTAQRQQIRSILLDARAQRKLIWQDDNQTLGAAKNRLANLRVQTRAKVEAVLTPAQRAQLDVLKGRLKSGLKDRRTPPGKV